MRLQKSHIPYSSTDLVSFLDCHCNFVELGGPMLFHQEEDDNSHVRRAITKFPGDGPTTGNIPNLKKLQLPVYIFFFLKPF